MKCPHCRNESNSITDIFCGRCGKQLSSLVNPPTPSPTVSRTLPPLPLVIPPTPSPTVPPTLSPVNLYRRRRRGWLIIILLLLLVAVLIGGTSRIIVLWVLPHDPNVSASPTPVTDTPTQCASPQYGGIGITKATDGEYIGVSDGRFAFAINGPGGNDKNQAAAKQRTGDCVAAESLWNAATGVSGDSGDAESLIYLEDQQVWRAHINSGTPYITIVVATVLTGENAGVGYADLQGAYVAQREYNDSKKLAGHTLVRLLVANSGSNEQDAATVASQIVQLSQVDHTVVGVMGWPESSHTLAAIDFLTQAHIPMVSQSASSSLLTRRSSYFFRVNPSDTTQGAGGAKYAEQILHAKNVALFVDNTDPYSQSLATAFSTQFQNDGYKIVATENYIKGVGGHTALPGLLLDAESKNPDLIYFAGYASDAGVLLAHLPTSGPFASLAVMGGDGLYDLNSYPLTAAHGFNRLRFTAFAYPDEWDIQHLSGIKPEFFNEYISAYNPRHQYPPGTYRYTRADGDVILSYDAMVVMLTAGSRALTSNSHITGGDLRQALSEITGTNALQGVSGQISFGLNGDPVNKAVVILYVDRQGHIKMDSVQGCFLVNRCT